MKNFKVKKTIATTLILLPLLVALASCSSDCDCPTVPEIPEPEPQVFLAKFQEGVWPTADYDGAADTYLDQANPNDSDGFDEYIYVRSNTTPGTSRRTLLRFSLLGQLPLGINITKATVSLVGGNTVDPLVVVVQELSRTWSESSATWNQNGIMDNWQGGSCYSDTVGVYSTLQDGTAAVSFDLDPALVTSWLNGNIGNNGIRLRFTDESVAGNTLTHYSSNYPDPEFRPMLSVYYTVD